MIGLEDEGSQGRLVVSQIPHHSAFLSRPCLTLVVTHWGIKKFGNHGNQPLGSVHQRHMCGAREHSQPGTWQPNEIANDAPTEQAKHLDRVLRSHDVRISNDEQCRCLKCGQFFA